METLTLKLTYLEIRNELVIEVNIKKCFAALLDLRNFSIIFF